MILFCNNKVGLDMVYLVFILFSSVLLYSSPQIALSQSVQMEVVEIVGSQEQASRIAGSASVLSSADLEVYEYTDIHKILSTVPGVNFRPEEGYGLRPNISLRGTYADRSGKITLMEDGVLIAPAPYAASSAYYFPTTGRTSGVEVLKGPASIEHGPYTIGGAINLLSTPVPESASGFFNQELGTDGASRTHVHYGTSQENYGFLLEGHIWNSDGFDSLPDGGDTGFEKNDYIAKFRLNSDPSADIYHELNVKYQWSDELSNQTYVGLADADFRKNPHSRYGLTAYDNMDNEHDGISFNYILDTGNLEFSALIYKNEFQRDWFKVDKIDNKKVYGIGNGINNIIGAANSGIATASAILNGNNSEAVEIKLKHNNRSYSSDGVNLRMEWGTDRQLLSVGYRNTEDDEDRFQWYETANWYTGKLSALTAGDKPGYSSNNRVTYSEASAFFINEEIYLGDLTLNFGYRSEEWKISQDRFVDTLRSAVKTSSGYPKKLSDSDNSLIGFGATYDINDTTSLLFGFHEGFTPTGGGADPEEADNMELGVRYVNSAGFFELLYFNTDYKNMFGNCTSSGGALGQCEIGDSFNAGAATIKGFELVGRKNIVASSGVNYPISLTYTSTNAEFDNTFGSAFWGNVTAGMDIPDTPDSQLALRAGFEAQNGWKGTTTFYSYGGTCSVASCAAGTQVEPYRLIDVSLSRTFGDQLDMYLVIENITDEDSLVARAPKNGARAQKPRSAVFGIRYRM